jgi:hypothetical protein
LELVSTFKSCLPQAVKRENLLASIKHLAGEKLTEELISNTAWRLAGNLPRLRAGAVGAPPWHLQRADEWVPVQIEDARFARTKRQLGYTFDFRVMAGTPCTLVIEKFWSLQFCRRMSRFMGFSRFGTNEKTGEVPYNLFRDATELVTLRLQVLITPELSDKEPGFKQTKVGPAAVAWNREQMRFRARQDAEHACPKNLSANILCHRCPFGYRTCRAGTHVRDYRIDACKGCRAKRAFFDGHISGEVCLACIEKDVKENK